MSFRFLTAFLKSSGDGGVVLFENDGAQRTVMIDRQALLTFTSPPCADESRLQDCVPAICEIAAAKLRQRKSGPFERIRISEDDVKAWKLRVPNLH